MPFEKVNFARTLTTRDLKDAIIEYVHSRYGEDITAFKFHPDLPAWLFRFPFKFPNPDMRVIELTVRSGNTIQSTDAREAYGVNPQ